MVGAAFESKAPPKLSKTKFDSHSISLSIWMRKKSDGTLNRHFFVFIDRLIQLYFMRFMGLSFHFAKILLE